MEKYANIGCTYWAIIGLDGYKSIYDDDFKNILDRYLSMRIPMHMGKQLMM